MWPLWCSQDSFYPGAQRYYTSILASYTRTTSPGTYQHATLPLKKYVESSPGCKEAFIKHVRQMRVPMFRWCYIVTSELDDTLTVFKSLLFNGFHLIKCCKICLFAFHSGKNVNGEEAARSAVQLVLDPRCSGLGPSCNNEVDLIHKIERGLALSTPRRVSMATIVSIATNKRATYHEGTFAGVVASTPYC